MPDQPHVMILGAGFGGIGALKKLDDANVRVTIIDKRDYHTFQPLLYQVATDELAPGEVGFSHPGAAARPKKHCFPSSRGQRRRFGQEGSCGGRC